jgi:hypothetical protein
MKSLVPSNGSITQNLSFEPVGLDSSDTMPYLNFSKPLIKIFSDSKSAIVTGDLSFLLVIS